MNHAKIALLFFILLSPLSSFGQTEETATGTEPVIEQVVIAPETITANVNIRHKESLVWTGTVTLTKNSTSNITDSSGTSRPIASDSALVALSTADLDSSDFGISDLTYYADFGSYFMNCINISALSKNACGNWQYVVNSTYPQVGLDKYVLQNEDTVYYFFGSPRRVSVPLSRIEAEKPFTVIAESYNYRNDTWQPLGGASIGITQENPNDPYSPIVLQTSTSGNDGTTSFSIPRAGAYSVGIASDYYFPGELITVIPPIEKGTGGTLGWSLPPAETQIATSTIATITPFIEPTKPIELVSVQKPDEDVLITLDISIEDFTERYKHWSAIIPTKVFVYQPKETAPVQNTATVLNAFGIDTGTTTATSTKTEKWYESFLHIFGF